METDQGPLPVAATVLVIALAMLLCYTLTGSPFPDPRPYSPLGP